ncbi:IS66 family transposase [Bradyrhizobium viridifuturi]|uniref:IS66 family transposase n=1 Tax=Bradyrhizobium viridifuturi TaxID=1654716 RepID=UPI0024BFAC13|nr:hypothetical protein [Bradyrhizobium viridifuturi]
MFAAQGITLDPQTLALWMGRLAWRLKPLHALLHHAVMSYAAVCRRDAAASPRSRSWQDQSLPVLGDRHR